MSQVTQLLNAIDAGDSQAANQLLPLVYEELKKLAAARMAQEQPGQTLQPTAGLTNAEAAQALGIPERTARRHWSFARAWLYRELRRQFGS